MGRSIMRATRGKPPVDDSNGSDDLYSTGPTSEPESRILPRGSTRLLSRYRTRSENSESQHPIRHDSEGGNPISGAHEQRHRSAHASDRRPPFPSPTVDPTKDDTIDTKMGVIRKAAASRGSDGGTKYHCDVCSIDITSTVRINCADPSCRDYDLCVPCFSRGEKSKNHDPQTHSFRVVEQNSIPIYTEDWGADEELLMLEGSERYGLGSWADVAEHIGGYREKDEVRDHYINTYIHSSLFPLPELADPRDTELSERIPKEEFQARKKRRIEERQEVAKSAPPATPKQKPTASVPACHEVQGFMPGRLEFETEHVNDAEEAVQHMTFEPGDGIDPATGEQDEETTLKMTVFDIYNSKLMARAERKKVIFEHQLLDYKKNQALTKRRTKEENDLLHKAKPFAKMMNHEDFEAFNKDLLLEHNLRQAIAQLQEWRMHGVTDLKQGDKYEHQKAARVQRMQPQGQFDRMAQYNPKRKEKEPDNGPSEASKLVTPDLPLRFQRKPKTVPVFADSQPAVENEFDKMFAEANGNDSNQTPKPKTRYVVQPLANVTPWKLEEDKSLAPDLQLLSEEEIQLCNALHIRPKPYLALKEALVREAMKQGGSMKKKEARGVCRIDVNKANRLFDFMIHSGWITKA